jgi:hypothetical protein
MLKTHHTVTIRQMKSTSRAGYRIPSNYLKEPYFLAVATVFAAALDRETG